MRVGLLLFEGVEELDFVGPWEVLSYVNKIVEGSLEMIAIGVGAPIRAFNGLRFLPDVTLGDCPELDILIVPGGKGRLRQMSRGTTLDFVRDRYPKLQYLASVCTGSFILAEAGLLDGKKTTTHHSAYEEMEGYPEIELVRERVVRDGKIISAGGVASGIDLALYLVEELFGHEVASGVRRGIEYPRDHRDN